MQDAKSYLLTPFDIPSGFAVRDEGQRPLDLGSAVADQAHRVFGKSRFLKSGDAIWSEATVFPNDGFASDGWRRLVEYHDANPGYENVAVVAERFGDESRVHSGTMRGRPGLWAAVRVGTVVHRFNTYGVEAAQSLDLLRRQLDKHASVQGSAISDADAVQMSYVGFIDAFKTRDTDTVNEWWLRLQLAVQKGRFTHVQPLLDEFWDATGSGNDDRVKDAVSRLSAAVLALAPQRDEQ